MELRTGKVVDGKIVLEDDRDLVEGATVKVWVGDPSEPIRVSDEELALIRAGQTAAARGELIDARQFLRELRREG